MRCRGVAIGAAALLLACVAALAIGCGRASESGSSAQPQGEGAVAAPSHEKQGEGKEDGAAAVDGSMPQPESEGGKPMRIAVRCGSAEVVYSLNDSTAARELFAQLPLELELKPFSDNEMTAYPPEKLDVSDAPLAGSGGRGSLAYYQPWGDLVLFYGGYSGNASLFGLGEAESGSENIEHMQGVATIEAL